jgi:hypothetical protein
MRLCRLTCNRPPREQSILRLRRLVLAPSFRHGGQAGELDPALRNATPGGTRLPDALVKQRPESSRGQTLNQRVRLHEHHVAPSAIG